MPPHKINSLSFVIPVKDEEATLKTLHKNICDALSASAPMQYEIIYIDDGSEDNSWSELSQLTDQFPGIVKAIRFRRNFGKALALTSGFKASTGDVVFTMDADLQDDPTEIPRFLEKIEEGYDVVSGWKMNRQDPISKTLPSKLFNTATAKLFGIPIHDFNCGFKAYRKEVLINLKLYGELHRYIPVIAHEQGFRIGEIEVKHHQREHGVSKYGWERIPRGFVDLLTTLATTRYLKKPGHLFGGWGLVSGVIGVSILTYLVTLWFMGLGPIGNRPLFFLGILLVILSIQLISLGILAELITRNSDKGQTKDLIIEKRGIKSHG